jgi:predicted RNase H-like HicB family nuclease
MRFIVVLIPDEEAGGYNVGVPALPGCLTQGESIEESLDRARDTIAAYLVGETCERLRAAGVDPSVIVGAVDVDTAIPA